MSAEIEPKVSLPNPPGCAAYHQRIDRIERVTEQTSTAVVELSAVISRISERVTGLADAHAATLVAVQASTDASSRLSEAINRFDDKLDTLMRDYSDHKLDAERDRHSAPRVAIALWLTSLGFGAAVVFFIIEHWAYVVGIVEAVKHSEFSP